MLNKEKLIKIEMPLENELEELKRDSFYKTKSNKNMMSYWLPMVHNCGIKIPETIILQLNFEQYKWLISDNYKDEDIQKFNNNILNMMKDSKFNTNRTLFIKTGNFSNKFVFSFCKLGYIENIGEKFLNVFYGGMCVGYDDSSEIVVREYIEPKDNRGTIYCGMPLNTEFRVFYDFDTKKILGCFNYWDRETMIRSMYGDDLNTFKAYVDKIETDYESNKDRVQELVDNSMKNVNLSGKWSVDIIKVGNEFYLIDMALAEQSYYYNKLED